MAVNTTSIGSHSARVDYDAGESESAVFTAIDNVLTASGWSVHDGSPGGVSKVYVADNQDGATKKYVRVLMDSGNNQIEVSTYEDWDAANHTGVNKAPAVSQQVFLDLANGGDVHVFAQQMYLLLRGESGGNIGDGAVGCVERRRDNPADNAGENGDIPPFHQFESQRMYVNDFLLGSPRAFSGENHRQHYSHAGFGIGGPAVTRLRGLPNAPDPVSSSTIIWELRVMDVLSSDKRKSGAHLGPLFGLHGAQVNFGTFLDILKFPVDSQGIWNPSGTDTEHYIIPARNDGNNDQSGRFVIPK